MLLACLVIFQAEVTKYECPIVFIIYYQRYNHLPEGITILLDKAGSNCRYVLQTLFYILAFAIKSLRRSAIKKRLLLS
jgi:hypothetical protein